MEVIAPEPKDKTKSNQRTKGGQNLQIHALPSLKLTANTPEN